MDSDEIPPEERDEHCPSPEEICRQCAIIRAGWSARELLERASPADRPIPFAVPVVRVGSHDGNERRKALPPLVRQLARDAEKIVDAPLGRCADDPAVPESQDDIA